MDDVLNRVVANFNVQGFLDYLNSFHPKIQFTVETQEGGEFAFLDIKMIDSVNEEGEGCIETTVFRKKTHTNFYSHFTSFSSFRFESSDTLYCIKEILTKVHDLI